MKNKEIENGPRKNVYKIVNTKSICKDKLPHHHHGLANIFTSVGIPACCPELDCEDCFREMWMKKKGGWDLSCVQNYKKNEQEKKKKEYIRETLVQIIYTTIIIMKLWSYYYLYKLFTTHLSFTINSYYLHFHHISHSMPNSFL